MNPDAFALLDLPRSLWFEPGLVEQRFRERAAALHPDRAGTGSTPAFAALQNAAAVLSDPVRRIRHLLELQGHPARTSPAVPPDLQDIGFEAAGALQAAAGRIRELAEANSPLARALLASAILEAREPCESLLDRITQARARAEAQARTTDPAADPESLGRLADRLQYLARWEVQLREALLRLSV